MPASMADLNAACGARYTLELANKHWRYGQSSSQVAASEMHPFCQTYSTKSHQTRSSAASRLTQHTTHANAMMRLRLETHMPSYHPARMPNCGSQIHPEPGRGTTQFDPQSIWAARCGHR